MASLISWLKDKEHDVGSFLNQHVVQPIEHVAAPVVRQAQGAVAQVNPADNDRTYSTVMQKGPSYAPKPVSSVVDQITHNGLTNFAGGIAKPLAQFPIDTANLAYNKAVAPALNLPKLTPQQTQPISGISKFVGATGAPRQALGSGIQTALTIGTGGLARGVEAGAAKLGADVLPKIVSKPITGAVTGGVLGGPFNVGAAISNPQVPITAHNLGQAYKQGVIGGAELGAGGEALGVAAPVIAKAATSAIKTATPVVKESAALVPRANLQDQQVMRDYSDHLVGANPAQGQELNNLIASARQVGQKYGVDLTNGSIADRSQRVNSVLDQIGQKNKDLSQGGYARIPGANVPEEPLIPPPLPQPKMLPERSSASSNFSISPEAQPLTENELAKIQANRFKTLENPSADGTTGLVPASESAQELGLSHRFDSEHFQNYLDSGGYRIAQPIQGLSSQKLDINPVGPPRITGRSQESVTLPTNLNVAASPLDETSQTQLPLSQQNEILSPSLSRPPLQNQKNIIKSSPSTNNTPTQRGFTTSVKNSPEVSGEVRRSTSGTYIPRNTAELAVKADNYSKGNLSKATKEVNDSLAKPTGTVNDQEIANSIAVAKRLDAKNNFDAAQQIYDRLAEHGTKGGQIIQAFSLLRNRTPQGMKFQAIRSLKKAGVELDAAGQKELSDHIDIISKTKPNTTERDMAIHNLVQFVNKHIPAGLPDKIVNFWRAGLLTSPVTTGGNILGNASEALTRNVFTNPIGAAADKAMSLLTGKRTKTLVGGQLPGGKLGVKKAGTYLKTGFDERNPNAKFDAPQQLNYNNKAIGKYVNGVYRWMGGQDQPFYYAAKNQASRDLATADALNLGLKGQAAKDYIRTAENNPDWKPQTFKSRSDAETAAKYSVYQNDTLIGHMASGMKNYADQHSKFGGAVANFLLPFTRVPASVAMRVIDRTPVGILKEGLSQLINIKKGHGFDQRAMAEAIGNGSFGVGVYFLGAGLAKSGLITGAYPNDPKERALWKSEGKQEYSVKVGNRWYSLNYMQPFGTILAIGAQIHNDRKDGASFTEAWNKAGATALQSVENQSFLQGLNGVLSAINDPERSATQYLTTTASSIVPNLIRTTARAIDPLQRDTKGAVQGVEGAIPGIRQTLPAKQDMFGKPLPGYDTPANQFANPLRPSKSKGSPLISELQRLQDSGNGIIPTQFNKNSIKGAKLSDQQVRQLNASINPQVQTAWGKAINTSDYQTLSDEDKATYLKRIKDQISKNTKSGFAQSNNLPAQAASSISSGKSPAQKYKDALNTYNATKNTMSDVQRYATEKSLAKMKAQAPFSNDVIKLYGMSKANAYDFLAKDKSGKKLADQLVAYDQALYNAGLSSYLKYKNGIAPAAKGGSKGSRSKGAPKTTLKAILAAQSAAIKATGPIKTAKSPNLKVTANRLPASYKRAALKNYAVTKPRVTRKKR